MSNASRAPAAAHAPGIVGPFAGMDVLIHDPADFEVRLAARQHVDIALPFAL